MRNFSIKVPLTLEHVRERIKNENKNFDYKEDYDQIIISKPIWYKNDFAPILYLKIHSSEDETTIDGQLKMRAWVKVFMFFWFGFLGLATIAIFFGTLDEINKEGKPITEFKYILFPIGMILGGIVLIEFGKFIARNNTQEIVDWFFKLFPNGVLLTNEQSRNQR